MNNSGINFIANGCALNETATTHFGFGTSMMFVKRPNAGLKVSVYGFPKKKVRGFKRRRRQDERLTGTLIKIEKFLVPIHCSGAGREIVTTIE